MCPRYNDKCVKVIERKGAEVLVNMSTIALKNWTSTGTITTTPPTAFATSITGATPPPAYLQGPWHWHFQLSSSRISDDLIIT